MGKEIFLKINFKLMILLFVFCSLLAHSGQKSKEEKFLFHYPILKVNKVLDGDTFSADFSLGFNLFFKNEKIRLLGCDAQELKTPKGPEAKKFTQDFLSTGSLVLITFGERDSFGRILATVEKDGIQLDDALTSAGLTTGRFRE